MKKTKRLFSLIALIILSNGLIACMAIGEPLACEIPEHGINDFEILDISDIPLSFIVGDFDELYDEQGNLVNAISLQYVEGVHYLFLPHWAAENDIIPYFVHANATATLGEEQLYHGCPIDPLYHGQELQFSMNNVSFTVIPLVGSDIPTIFINTDSGSLEDIHAEQSHREETTFLFIDSDGNLEHFGRGDMNGRGNWTWTRPKRPYNFRLASGTSLPLFGLGEGRHWTLLANYLDNTLIRNQVSLNLAREVNIPHTSQLLSVDLFINNEFQGTYDLVERRNLNHAVHINDMGAATETVNNNPLSSYPHMGIHYPEPSTFRYFDIPNNPRDITGDFLIELQLQGRYLNNPSGFVTDLGTPVVLASPEYATRAQIEYISTFFQRLEDAVYSETGYNSYGNHFSYYMDVESFARMYILLEFVIDFDAGRTSFFMIKESSHTGRGVIYAAPPWDFDNTFGASPNREDTAIPDAFFANGGRSAAGDDVPHLLTALNRHESFQEEVVNLWQTEFAPLVRVLIGYDTDTQTYAIEPMQTSMDRIAASAYMNRTLWPDPMTNVTDIISFARVRYEFLESHWGVNRD